MKTGSTNLAVINTASELPTTGHWGKLFLIVDECHKAASDSFRKVLDIKSTASLGLSATPERPYDDGLEKVLIPALGPVIFTYDYAAALKHEFDPGAIIRPIQGLKMHSVRKLNGEQLP